MDWMKELGSMMLQEGKMWLIKKLSKCQGYPNESSWFDKQWISLKTFKFSDDQ